MMRAIRKYGIIALLGTTLLVSIAGGRFARAMTLPAQIFNDLLEVSGVVNQLRGTNDEAVEITATLVEAKLAAQGIDGAIDVGALVQDGDLSSVYALENLTPSEKAALVENVLVLYEQTGNLVDRAKHLSSQSAMTQQPGDREGGGFQENATSDDANSHEDIMTDLDQYQDLLAQQKEQMEEIEELWKKIQKMLSTKPANLPEKSDYDPYVVCIDYIAGNELYPLLYEDVTDDFITELHDPYEPILKDVTTSVQRSTNVGQRLTDETDDPIQSAEVAFLEAESFEELLTAGDAVVQGNTQSVGDQLKNRYGEDFEPAGTLQGIAQSGKLVDMAAATVALDAMETELPAALATANASIIEGLKSTSATGGLNAEALQTARTALGPEGGPLIDRYASIVQTGARSRDLDAVQASRAALEKQVRAKLDTNARAYTAKVTDAKRVSSSFAEKSPDELLAAATKAKRRVEFRNAANAENRTSAVSRLEDRENYQKNVLAELELWENQVDDIRYITSLLRTLQKKASEKPPTR